MWPSWPACLPAWHPLNQPGSDPLAAVPAMLAMQAPGESRCCRRASASGRRRCCSWPQPRARPSLGAAMSSSTQSCGLALVGLVGGCKSLGGDLLHLPGHPSWSHWGGGFATVFPACWACCKGHCARGRHLWQPTAAWPTCLPRDPPRRHAPPPPTPVCMLGLCCHLPHMQAAASLPTSPTWPRRWGWTRSRRKSPLTTSCTSWRCGWAVGRVGGGVEGPGGLACAPGGGECDGGGAGAAELVLQGRGAIARGPASALTRASPLVCVCVWWWWWWGGGG